MTAFPDILIEKLASDCDFIVVACDGIWDCLSSQEVVTFVGNKVKQKKGKDNLASVTEDLFDQILA